MDGLLPVAQKTRKRWVLLMSTRYGHMNTLPSVTSIAVYGGTGQGATSQSDCKSNNGARQHYKSSGIHDNV